MTKVGSRKLHICPKVTKIGSIIGHRIDYNGVVALRGGGTYPAEISPPPGTCHINTLKLNLRFIRIQGVSKFVPIFFFA